MSNTFREVDPASIWHRPDQSQVGNTGQRVGRIRQKMEMGPDGKPRLQMNIGQRRFGLDESIERKPGHSGEQSQRKRRRRPSTTIQPETTTEERTTSSTTRKTSTTTTTERPRVSSTTSSTTISTTQRQLTEVEMKKKQKLRDRLSKLTPEERLEFFEKRRKKKEQRQASLNNV